LPMEWVVVHIELGRPIEPREISDILARVAKEAPADQLGPAVVIISGRIPIWLAAALTHYYHPTAVVATFDPRYNAGIVVASHRAEFKVGDLVSVAGARKVVITYP